MQKYKLILASASPRRRQLLREAGFSFTIMPSHCNEKTTSLNPKTIVEQLARRKALDVAQKISGKHQPCAALMRSRTGMPRRRIHAQTVKILGADTIVVLGKKILGKPDSTAHARSMLGRLSGTWHRVYTGVAVATMESVNDDALKTLPSSFKACGWHRSALSGNLAAPKYMIRSIHTGYAVSKVKMRLLSPSEIAGYSRRHPDKAGAYAVQEKRDPVVERIIGEYTNVVGLPMPLVKKLLK